MSTSRLAQYLAGERLDDVAIYLAPGTLDNPDTVLAEPYAEPAGDGVVIVVVGDRGRSVFERLTGTDPMVFASAAMDTPGTIDPDLTDGECPNAVEGPQDHGVRFVFSFAEARNEEVGGLYAQGDVLHAYAQCRCGTAYGDKWLVDERTD
ncbi:MAG: DUF5807 family protein [Halodesulfurarchaeum sp.]